MDLYLIVNFASDGHSNLQKTIPVVELELIDSSDSVMIIHVEATLLGKC